MPLSVVAMRVTVNPHSACWIAADLEWSELKKATHIGQSIPSSTRNIWKTFQMAVVYQTTLDMRQFSNWLLIEAGSLPDRCDGIDVFHNRK